MGQQLYRIAFTASVVLFADSLANHVAHVVCALMCVCRYLSLCVSPIAQPYVVAVRPLVEQTVTQPVLAQPVKSAAVISQAPIVQAPIVSQAQPIVNAPIVQSSKGGAGYGLL